MVQKKHEKTRKHATSASQDDHRNGLKKAFRPVGRKKKLKSWEKPRGQKEKKVDRACRQNKMVASTGGGPSEFRKSKRMPLEGKTPEVASKKIENGPVLGKRIRGKDRQRITGIG